MIFYAHLRLSCGTLILICCLESKESILTNLGSCIDVGICVRDICMALCDRNTDILGLVVVSVLINDDVCVATELVRARTASRLLVR